MNEGKWLCVKCGQDQKEGVEHVCKPCVPLHQMEIDELLYDIEALEKENAELKAELNTLRAFRGVNSLSELQSDAIRDFMALHAIDMGDYYEVSMKAVDKLEQNNET